MDLNELLRGFRQEEESDLFHITREQYVADRDASTRGTANPSVMNKPFWMFQVGPGGLSGWSARTTFGNAEDPFADSKEPVWCFTRYGASCTKLPDGRVVCIGGEHEDWYDPDFCIYNGKSFPPIMNGQEIDRLQIYLSADVVVFDPPQKSDLPPLLTSESIKIYGYPLDIFPPTDSHTSTYFADPIIGKESIIIVGGLGYAGQASSDRTDVYQLSLIDFSIQRVDTSGVGPTGGTHHHEAELITAQGQAAIKITTEAVKELVDRDGGEEFIKTEEDGTSSTLEESKKSTISDSQESISAEGGRDSDHEEESNVSSTIPREAKVLVTTQESKVFTLRLHDMRWI